MTQQQGRWHDICAGGSLKHSTWRHNPQFSLSSSSLTRVVVSLTQLSNGGKGSDTGNNDKYQRIALYAIRGAHPSDIASLLLPGGSYGGSGRIGQGESNGIRSSSLAAAAVAKTRERAGSMPTLVFGGSVENDVNLTTLEGKSGGGHGFRRTPMHLGLPSRVKRAASHLFLSDPHASKQTSQTSTSTKTKMSVWRNRMTHWPRAFRPRWSSVQCPET